MTTTTNAMQTLETPAWNECWVYICRAHFTQVYQVTRAGHEHCDVTEGVLLDITPLIVDGRKLVTLYDKDLTEGTNLLIGEYIWYIYI